MVPAKLHGNGWVLTSELTSKWITFKNTHSNFTLISLITFEVLNQTSPNLQGCCRNTNRWCLQNYRVNGWELTSRLTSKWITFKNTHSNKTLISLITFEVLNQTSPNLQFDSKKNRYKYIFWVSGVSQFSSVLRVYWGYDHLKINWSIFLSLLNLPMLV